MPICIGVRLAQGFKMGLENLITETPCPQVACCPRSASNYLLGLSPLRFAPYITGTLAGMAVWSTVYASLGGASRALLQSGVEPDVLLAGARALWHCSMPMNAPNVRPQRPAPISSHAWLLCIFLIIIASVPKSSCWSRVVSTRAEPQYAHKHGILSGSQGDLAVQTWQTRQQGLSL